MEINVNDNQRLVSIWLTRSERDNPAVMGSLKPLYRLYKPKKYTVAVYLSGDQDLYRLTSDLICYNRKRIAELEVEDGKAQ